MEGEEKQGGRPLMDFLYLLLHGGNLYDDPFTPASLCQHSYSTTCKQGKCTTITGIDHQTEPSPSQYILPYPTLT